MYYLVLPKRTVARPVNVLSKYFRRSFGRDKSHKRKAFFTYINKLLFYNLDVIHPLKSVELVATVNKKKNNHMPNEE
jgi:hypothetical protein